MYREELRGLYASSNIIPVTKSRMMRKFGGCIKHGGEEKCTQEFGSRTSSKKGRLEDLGEHGGILKQIFEEQDGQA